MFKRLILLHFIVFLLISNIYTYQVISDELERYIENEGSICLRDIQGIPDDIMPERINELYILAYPEDTQDTLFLLGENLEDTIYDFGVIEFSGEMNIAKTSVLYDNEDGYIYIYSQQPFTSFYYGAKYNWNPEDIEMELLDEWSENPAVKSMEEMKVFLEKGEFAKADEILWGIQYPDYHQLAVNYLIGTFEYCERLYENDDIDGACRCFKNAMSPFELMFGPEWVFEFDSRTDYEESGYSDYMDYSELREILKTYAEYKKEAGDKVGSKEIFDYLEQLDKN
jgi:hypothetical protein